jgi:MFS family permease
MRSATTAAVAARPMSAEEKKVIFASSLGTVFEWYDFYLYGSLAAIIAKQFFSGLDEGSAFIFALLAFAAGFIVRPFGAMVFGRLGDMIGRKYTFLVTILIMGLSTFIVGILPNYATIGVAAPVILIGLRMLQGLALGGEYGGAATYVAEHAPQGKRGAYTSWIQTTATLGPVSQSDGDSGYPHHHRRSSVCRLGLACSVHRVDSAAGGVGLHPFEHE